MRAVAIAAVVLAAGCSKCGAPNAPDAAVDAGRAITREKRTIDVRTALIYAYPEYRGTALLDTTVRVRREIPGLTDASRDAALAKLNFVASDAGSGWDLSQFHVEAIGPETLEITITLDADHVGHLYIAPTGLSSQQMALYLPRELPTRSEVFELDLHYSSSAERCVQLIEQAKTLLLGTQQWKVVRAPDFDAGVPDEFTVELKNDDGATVKWERVRGQVHALYSLRTVGD